MPGADHIEHKEKLAEYRLRAEGELREAFVQYPPVFCLWQHMSLCWAMKGENRGSVR